MAGLPHRDQRTIGLPHAAFVGTMVRYYPVWGQWATATTHYVSARAFVSASKEPAVALDGVSGCVSIWNCEPVIIDAAEAA